MSPISKMQAIASTLAGYKLSRGTELKLQDDIGKVFTANCIPCVREWWLSEMDKPDFIVHNIAIECKIKGSVEAHLRQIKRYMKHEEVHGCIIVATRPYVVPDTVEGKPLMVIGIANRNL